ncbi:hypothetical protein LT104_10400 [Lacticaseibacillus zeae]|uniref:hypothetical protein n=1 Tax=Lacticaseibacillus zeae TaxID=57037 RepID=UPI0009F49773|nr:hypothetical protein [Lacticaseibacillus zeae]MDE3316310.1 hypothetical protein [Lacticaseibacillus zeae]
MAKTAITSKATYTPTSERAGSRSKKMASRFDLLNADAPIVTNSPWFGTVLEYSMALATKTRVVAAVDYKDTVKYQKSASKQVKASCSNYSPPFRLAVFRLI